ncbi:MAG TPA: hypothetical protein VEU47_16480 [Candidatus Cybelea sp.]|nr:hypothetical protein [Candidatus Cybelea sp.]
MAQSAASPPVDPKLTTPALQKYMASPEHWQAVVDSAQRQNAIIPGSCSSLVFSHTGIVRQTKPVTMRPDGTPDEGFWGEAIEGKGCGTTKQFNLYTIAAANQPIKVIAAVPGNTHADILLQRDSLQYVFLAAGVAAKDCKQQVVTEATFGDYEGGPLPNALAGPNARPWRETWTVWACGKLLDVPVHYLPDATGTGISVSNKEIKTRP